MLKTKIGPPDGFGYYVITSLYEDTMYRGRIVPGRAVTRVFRRAGDQCRYDTALESAACENRSVAAARQHESMVRRWMRYHRKGEA